MATFADMMTLLLCFFVLLTSTSVQDAKKYKAMVESMQKALGVTTEISMDQTQMVTTGIANQFIAAQTAPKVETESIDQLKEKAMQATLTEIKNQGEKIKEDLKDEIGKGLITVDIKGLQIIMRIEEKGSFTSGSAILKSGFEPVMDKITDSIKQAKGNIRVAGHTDDIPITTSSYRSNWELSSSRAVTVAHYILDEKGITSSRVAIEGYADTKPLVPNDSAENRAKNRRVEVILLQEDPTLKMDQKKTGGTEPDLSTKP
jgi:chemotaxis protein MotB